MAVLHLSLAFDDDVGVWLEQADDFVGGGNALAVDNPPLCLCNDLQD